MRRLFPLFLLIMTLCSCAHQTAKKEQPESLINSSDKMLRTQWVTTWATAEERPGKGDVPQQPLNQRTLEQTIHVSVGGDMVRLRLSNIFGESELDIVGVKIQADSDPSKTATLTFGGKAGITLKGGETAWSDGAVFPLVTDSRLHITITYGDRIPNTITCHRGSRTTSLLYPAMGQSEKEKLDHWYTIAALDVKAESEGCIAIIGNSITDGRGSTTNMQNRWSDFFSTKLADKYGVANLGIGGNCVIKGGLSEPAMVRFDRDVLGQTNLCAIIVFEGTNDIGIFGDNPKTADDLIEAYKVFIKKGHDRQLPVYGCTITPVKGSNYFSEKHEAVRLRVNEWIREHVGSDGFDGCIDFDKAVCNPADPQAMRQELQDDWLHLNPAGYKVMGEYAAEIFKKAQ